MFEFLAVTIALCVLFIAGVELGRWSMIRAERKA